MEVLIDSLLSIQMVNQMKLLKVVMTIVMIPQVIPGIEYHECAIKKLAVKTNLMVITQYN